MYHLSSLFHICKGGRVSAVWPHKFTVIAVHYACALPQYLALMPSLKVSFLYVLLVVHLLCLQ